MTGVVNAVPHAGQWAGFLGMLTSRQRDSLLGLGATRAYRPGQVVLREGNPGDLVVIILHGLARVTAVTESGKEVLLGFRTGGDLVGEMAVVSRKPRSATVTAATELCVKLIHAVPFEAYLARSPEVAKRVSDIMAEKLRAANRRRLEFNAYPAEWRIARVLAEVAQTYGHAEEGTWRIGSEITQADLASLASASVRTVEKILRVLDLDGVVTRRRRDLIVRDLGALAERAPGAIRPGRDCLPFVACRV
jgi:CRP-like cAMP-binding protein